MKVPIRGNYIKKISPISLKIAFPCMQFIVNDWCTRLSIGLHASCAISCSKKFAARCARATRYSMKIGGKKWSEILGGEEKK